MRITSREYEYLTNLRRIRDIDLTRLPALGGICQVPGSDQRKGASPRQDQMRQSVVLDLLQVQPAVVFQRRRGSAWIGVS